MKLAIHLEKIVFNGYSHCRKSIYCLTTLLA